MAVTSVDKKILEVLKSIYILIKQLLNSKNNSGYIA